MPPRSLAVDSWRVSVALQPTTSGEPEPFANGAVATDNPGGLLLYAGAAMLLSADALGQTLALLATFLGIGVLVNVLIAYVIGQVLGERKQNQERQQRAE
jgi:hypothetical protein